MSTRITTRAMTSAASSSNAGARTAKTSNNAKTSKDRQTGRANNTKGKSKKRQKTHHITVDAMPDPRAPKKARSGYELFLLAGGIEFQVGNIINKKDLKAFRRLNDEWQRMTENDRTNWAGQGVLDRIRFAAEMEMYHGTETVQAITTDYAPELSAEDVKKMKEREDKAKHIAACTFLQVVEMKKRQKMAAMVSPGPGLVASSAAASSISVTSTTTATNVSTAATDISTIATPVSSNKSGGPKHFGSANAAPALVELSSDSSFSDTDPDEVFI